MKKLEIKPTVLGRTTSARWSRAERERAEAAAERGAQAPRRYFGGCELPVYKKPKR